MTPELKELLKKVVKAKWITLLLIAIGLVIFVWHNFEFLSEVSFTLKKPEMTNKTKEEYLKDRQTCCPHLEVGQVLVPPAPKKLPVIIVFQVKNSGEATTRQVRVFVDFGSSKVIAYEVIGPKEDFVSGSEPGSSVINLDIKYLRPHESAYIYAQTSNAVFSKIVLSSSDTLSAIEYNYSDYLTSTRKDAASLHGFVIFLLVLAGLVLTVITIYFLIVLLQKLNKWLKVK